MKDMTEAIRKAKQMHQEEIEKSAKKLFSSRLSRWELCMELAEVQAECESLQSEVDALDRPSMGGH